MKKIKITVMGEVDDNVIIRKVTEEQFIFLKAVIAQLDENMRYLDFASSVWMEEVKEVKE